MLPSDQIFTLLLGALASGMVVGSIPLVIAIKGKRDGLGYGLFAVCIVASLAVGLLGSVPAAIISVMILLLTKKKGQHDETK